MTSPISSPEPGLAATAPSAPATAAAAAPAPSAPAVPPADLYPVLTARGLHKTYGPTAALAGVDLEVRRGESIAIMGASGSGKTTLLHCLAGIVVPDLGGIRFAGPGGFVEIAGLPESERSRLRREAFGFVFQQGLLVPELTAIENVALALMVGGVRRAAAEQQAAAWLADLGLAGLEQRRIGQLSGGQAQRVAIARAVVTGAPVIFADEPTGALDSHTSREVMDALLRMTVDYGRTLVVVTHDADVAARCSRTVHMRDGRIVAADAAPAATAPAAAAPASGAGR
ncbi:ABC transporter ATP-binding protein [Schumannella sp. 10F1B-5-1]|uniref:ABC transporter ATP-binding protein n=1 Tax=Schumannella sp. 10F1B-5-1 TaxID=2590780 RepID=UPI0011311CF6|nr:ABC transporter ATP-binding protein [Schumannella sp. 10F1B-5-1]TPW76902.1 ABC transporter ATP-binding protein [Schumannella sp. 10F1B-5-1]